jgi:hypothetical protein
MMTNKRLDSQYGQDPGTARVKNNANAAQNGNDGGLNTLSQAQILFQGTTIA